MSDEAVTKNYAVREKWGIAALGGEDTGWQGVPNLLLTHQEELGLSSTEVVVLLNITMHWWSVDELPFVWPAIIADRMGVEKRTVERAFKKLQEHGFIFRRPTTRTRQGQARREIELKGTKNKLCDLAKQFLSKRDLKDFEDEMNSDVSEKLIRQM